MSSVWVGLAGCDQPGIAKAVNQALETLFKRSLGSGLGVTNDIELLVIPVTEKQSANSAVVLVAGTKSVEMSFKRQGHHFRRMGRSVSWGHLLGDDGSGFDIGRQAIRMVMAAIDRHNNFERSLGVNVVHKPQSVIGKVVLDHFRPQDVETGNFDLLSAVLSDSSGLEKKA